MAIEVYFEAAKICDSDPLVGTSAIKHEVSNVMHLPFEDIYATINGRPAPENLSLHNGSILRLHTRLVGGKGGFGSMLRAIGAQIEKTTNREACRDLSGRRLRDINEEQRLRKWLNGQSDRDREAVERKQRRLERLCAEPRPVAVEDKVYEASRAELPERVSASVEAGWQQAANSSASGATKRKPQDVNTKGKKKAKLWIDADLSGCSSGSEDEGCLSEHSQQSVAVVTGEIVSSDSGNESDPRELTSSSPPTVGNMQIQ